MTQNGTGPMSTSLKSVFIPAAFVLACCSCAWFGENAPVGVRMEGITVSPLGETERRFVSDELFKGGPVSFYIPNPFSNIISFGFYLPAAANIRVITCDDTGKLASMLLDERVQKGAYKLEITGSALFQKAGKFTIKFLVNKKLMDTKNVTILK